MGCGESKESQERRPTLRKREDNAVGIKVVLLGDTGVGKSSICSRYINNTINEAYDVTLGGAYFQKEVTVDNNRKVKLHIWDTGGEERFRAMASLYYKDAKAALLVYDVNDARSLQSLEYWVRELDEKVRDENMILRIVGNKCDLAGKKVSEDVVKKYAEDAGGLKYVEVSAKTGVNINDLFQSLAKDLADNLERER